MARSAASPPDADSHGDAGVWRPLLEGPLAERASAAVDAVARDFLAPAPAWIPGGDAELFRRVRGASLARGRAGLAVFYAYLARSGRRATEHDPWGLAEEHLDRACDVLAEVPMPPSLYRGFAGIAWAMEHLWRFVTSDETPGGGTPDGTEDDPCSEIDRILLDAFPEDVGFDLWDGCVGLGVYALERLPRPAARTLLERVVAALETAAEDRSGACWRTLPEHVADRFRGFHREGFYQLGLAHGAAGVVVFLARAVASDVDAARPLLASAVARLLEDRWPAQSPTPEVFPTRLRLDGTRIGGMAAWCHGDPGIASALLLAGRLAGEPAWEREGLAVARGAAARLDDPACVTDAGLCHGAAGLGHLFNRMFQSTGDTAFGDAARFWLARVLDRQFPGEGPGGFAAWGYGPDGDLCQLWDPGIVQGAAGVALALLAGVSEVAPDWDRMMLLSSPEV